MIEAARLEPDIVTYGVLSLGCKTREEIQDFLQQMYDKGIKYVFRFIDFELYIQKILTHLVQNCIYFQSKYPNIRCHVEKCLHGQRIRFRIRNFTYYKSGASYAQCQNYGNH